MVDVEQRALRAFEQDALALARASARAATIPNPCTAAPAAPAPSSSVAEVLRRRSARDRDHCAARCGARAAARSCGRASRRSARSMRRMRAPPDLVLVGRADAAPRGADAASPRSRLRAIASSSRCSGRISGVFSAMRRLSGVTVDALFLRAGDFIDQRRTDRARRRCR